MREGRWKALLRKSTAACIAAMDVYNKPIMPHRDETFAMLAVNAWELLLKARLLKDANNNARAIQVLVPKRTKNGQPSKRFRVEQNRAGNPKTITLGEAIHRVSSAATLKLDPACAANIWSLVEIRDNAVHFINEDPEVSRRTHEIGCACLRNYTAAVAEWFEHDLSEYRFMILPLSFEGVCEATALTGRRSRHASNLIGFLDKAAGTAAANEGTYAVTIQVETRIVGSRAKDAIAVRLGGGPEAPIMRLTEEQIRERWPLDYAALQKRAKARLPGLKFNRTFNEAMRTLKVNPTLVHRRHLDPSNPKSPKKEFFADGAVDALVRALSIEQGGPAT